MTNEAPTPAPTTFTAAQLDEAHDKLLKLGQDVSHNGPVPIYEALVAAQRARLSMGMGFGGMMGGGHTPSNQEGPAQCGRSWVYTAIVAGFCGTTYPGAPRPELPADQKMPAAPAPSVEAAAVNTTISINTFNQADLRVGLVLSAERIPKKDKLLDLRVDLGEPEPRRIVAGLGKAFTPEQLVGQRVIVVANLEPRDFGKGMVSRGMILAAGDGDSLSLVTINDQAKPGYVVG